MVICRLENGKPILKHANTGVCLAMDFRNDRFVVEATIVRWLQLEMSEQSRLMYQSCGLKLKPVGMKQ